jgi:uncharacterized protein YggT (Ycf19 family)
MIRLISALISLFIGLAEICLGLRVIFRLFAANEVEFVRWIYQTSDQLLQPFGGIFSPDKITSGHVLDFTALFGIVVYALLGWLLIKVLHVFSSSKKHDKN